jgi:S-adenosylmethionine/arginine decarboxylase-like enzyme
MEKSTQMINQLTASITLSKFPKENIVIIRLIEKLILRLNLTVVEKVSHEFAPQGLTLVYILSQSHMAVHTWPEINLIHIDLVSCSSTTKEAFELILSESFVDFGLLNQEIYSHEIRG